MTTDYTPRLFENDAAICHIGEGLLTCTLTHEEWTHEAHLAACTWLLRERPDIDAERELPAIISRFNESVGGVNDDHNGYHETITQCFVLGVRLHLNGHPTEATLVDAVNALLLSEKGRRDWPLHFYSRDRLFSVEARRSFVAPDLSPLPIRPRPSAPASPRDARHARGDREDNDRPRDSSAPC